MGVLISQGRNGRGAEGSLIEPAQKTRMLKNLRNEEQREARIVPFLAR
jgi:hypothetical protein